MMPSLTTADALIQAADNLTTALAGVIPPPSMTTEAIAQLISIFKTQAEKEKDDATVQRVLRERAQAERVLTETIAPTTKLASEPTVPQQTTYPPLEIKEYPQVDGGTISYPDDNSNSARPANNTRYQRKVRTITQGYLFSLDGHSVSPKTIIHRQTSQLTKISTTVFMRLRIFGSL